MFKITGCMYNIYWYLASEYMVPFLIIRIYPRTGLFPVNQDFPEADRNTREFLHRVVDILLDYVTKENDRTTKILDFHHPEQMKQSIDLEIPEKALNLDQLLVDCKDTMKYGVKTGKFNEWLISS